MAKKVLPKEQQNGQHYLSGVLALVILVFPISLILHILYLIASFPWLLNTIVLYLCMQYSQSDITAKQIAIDISKNKKQLAKDRLSPLVLRDTAPLSALGVIKACIEQLSAKACYQQTCTMFVFVCFGPVAALTYRLCYEANQSWNIKQINMQRFGFTAHIITAFIQWIPSRLYALLLVIAQAYPRHIISGWKLVLSQLPKASSNGIILAALSVALQRNMGGAVKYCSQTYRRTRFDIYQEPSQTDIEKARTLVLVATIMFLTLMLILAALIYTN